MRSIENINLFLDRLGHSDQYIEYRTQKYFIEGCCCQFDDMKNVIAATLSVYRLPDWSEAFTVNDDTPDACVTRFLDEFRLDGKTIYEMMPDIKLIDD